VRDGRGLSSGPVLRDGDQGSPVEVNRVPGPSPRKRSRRSGAVDATAAGESADCRQLLRPGLVLEKLVEVRLIRQNPPAGALGPLVVLIGEA